MKLGDQSRKYNLKRDKKVERMHKQICNIMDPSFNFKISNNDEDDWEKMPFVAPPKRTWWQKFLQFFSFSWFVSPLS